MQMVYELAARLDTDPHWLATGEKAPLDSDLRFELKAAHARIRRLEKKLEAVAKMIRD
jgi:hypothetical protein